MERLVAAAVGAVLVAFLYLFVYRTKVGLAMRAIEEDEETARMLGINADRVAALACAIGFALAALAGAFVAPIYSMNPGMGLESILMSFLIIIVGGLGSITGTVLAGLLIGVLQSVGGVLIGAEAAYGLVFVVMIVVLIFRPAGLLGRHEARPARPRHRGARPSPRSASRTCCTWPLSSSSTWSMRRRSTSSCGWATCRSATRATSRSAATRPRSWRRSSGSARGSGSSPAASWPPSSRGALGTVTLKLRGIYFSLSVFAFAEVVNAVFRAFEVFGGLPASPRCRGPRCSGRDSIRTCSSITWCWWSRSSRCSSSTGCSGRASFILALRTSATEALAESIGINAARHKTFAFVVSCFFCGLMGAVHVHYLRFSPFVFTFFLSTDLMVYVMVGGLGSYWGPMLATLLLTSLGEQLFAAGYYKSLVYAVVLLVVILALPGGLISLPRIFRRGGREHAAPATAAATAARER